MLSRHQNVANVKGMPFTMYGVFHVATFTHLYIQKTHSTSSAMSIRVPEAHFYVESIDTSPIVIACKVAKLVKFLHPQTQYDRTIAGSVRGSVFTPLEARSWFIHVPHYTALSCIWWLPCGSFVHQCVFCCALQFHGESSNCSHDGNISILYLPYMYMLF